jgi:hypothetical protein
MTFHQLDVNNVRLNTLERLLKIHEPAPAILLVSDPVARGRARVSGGEREVQRSATSQRVGVMMTSVRITSAVCRLDKECKLEASECSLYLYHWRTLVTNPTQS